MTCIMCTTRPGDERVAQQMLSTGLARMLIETCTVMTWKTSCRQTGEFHKMRKQTLVVVNQSRLLYTGFPQASSQWPSIGRSREGMRDDQITATNYLVT